MAEFIEREAALLEIEERADTFCECDYVWPHVIESIKKLPAANVRPVVPARWFEDGPNLKCSNCGFACNDPFYLGLRYFCPNCGADMREAIDVN